MTNSTTTATSLYWNDHYTGACFLNNIRLVNTKKDPFLSLDVHVKQGKKEAGKTKTQRINVNVVGKRAEAIVSALLEKYDFSNGVKSDSNPKGHPPISAIFTIGDLWADAYMSDDKPRGALKGRLVALQHVYVENERFDNPEDFGEVQSSSDSEGAESAQEPQQSEASDNQADDVSEVKDGSIDPAEEERSMAVFVETAMNSDEISLDSSDPGFKKKLKFLMNNGFVWSDDAAAYVPKTVAA